MCTLLVAWRHFAGRPLVVAANRDEDLGRPSAPPRGWSGRNPAVFAPEDLRAGGTWLGVNDAGVFAAITNRFSPGEPPARDRRSRGLLVLDALEERGAASARRRIEQVRAREHNRFHLVVADLASAFVAIDDGERVQVSALAPGFSVVTERSFGAAPSGREDALRACALALSEMRASLAVHREPGFDGTCVHVAGIAYGTRSATLVEFSDGGPLSYHFADGPPCTAPWTDLSLPMLRALDRSG